MIGLANAWAQSGVKGTYLSSIEHRAHVESRSREAPSGAGMLPIPELDEASTTHTVSALAARLFDMILPKPMQN